MTDFIQNMPKAELHLHVDGSLEPKLLFELGERNGVEIKYKTVEEVREAFEFTNLQSFLDIYSAGAAVQLHEQDFYDVMWAYLKKASEQNVRHADIHFESQTHTERGVPFETVITGYHKAQVDAEKKLGITSSLILGIARHLSSESAMATLEEALPYKDWIEAIGLDFAEVGNPPEKFTEVFQRALDEGFTTTAHAGEEGDPSYIWGAIKQLKVSRIDHGVRCEEDEDLMKYLIDSQLMLAVCPLSNVKLRVFDTLKDHNIKRLYDRGVKVTVSSDDPSYFKSHINDNYVAIQKDLGFTDQDLYEITKNAFEEAFLEEAKKEEYIAELDAYMASQR
jgi:adenosine deaminase